MAEFTITLADGTRLGGFRLSGNNFITTDESAAAKFSSVLGRTSKYLRNVVIEGENEDGLWDPAGEHAFMEIVQCVKHGGEWHIVLRDLTDREIYELETDARISFLEMITEDE